MMMPSIISNRFFDDFFEDFAAPARNVVKFRAPQNVSMKTDIRETDAGFELAVDLPGFSRDNVSASLKDGYLTISAKKNEESEDKDDRGYIRRERFSGSASRSFYVGEHLSEEDISARYEDGVLNLFVPKKDPVVENSERLIEIK